VNTPAYPLQWPVGWKRTSPARQTRAAFGVRERTEGYRPLRDLTIEQATRRVRDALDRMGIRERDFTISTNLKLRQDGYPYSQQPKVSDPGVAVYWIDGKETRCMAVDRYDRIADNLAAVAATLEAMRAIERHGGAEILNRAYVGFAALPGPSNKDPEWWIVLGLQQGAHGVSVTDAYRRLRSQHHPDRGGDAEEFQRIERAYRLARDLGHT
jgi:hypothetical protein